MIERIELEACLDTSAAAGLHASLLAHEQKDIVCDASAVTRIGGMCLELFLCAQQVWKARGNAFSIENPSHDFAEQLARFGLSDGDLSVGGAP